VVFLVTTLFLGSATFAASGGTVSPNKTLGTILSRAESGQYRDGELLVKFKSGNITTQSLRVYPAAASTVLKRLSSLDVEHVQLPPGLGVKEAISQFMQDPDVEYAEPNYIFAISPVPATPNDPLFGWQWGLTRIAAPSAWDLTQGSPEVVIAVLDSGIDPQHPDLRENLDWSLARNFSDSDILDDYFGHGTHVAGIIGAVGNNGLGVAGLMWRVRLLNVKAMADDGFIANDWVAAAIDYLLTLKLEQGVNVRAMNMSFRAPIFSNVMYDAIAAASRNGMLAIASAGNEGINRRGYPAGFDLPNIISVAGTDANDQLADFSNYGRTWVHIAAPADNIWSTGPTHPNAFGIENYGDLSGTSMSTAFVTGLAGLLAAQYPHFTYRQIRGTILRYGDALDSLQGWVSTGRRINAYKAVSSLLAPTGLSIDRGASRRGLTLTWTDNATGEDGYVVERRTGRGSFVRIATLGRNRTSFTDTTRQARTAYTYRVRAFNRIPAHSRYSNKVVF
jgi:subtilisin family serine protease